MNYKNQEKLKQISDLLQQADQLLQELVGGENSILHTRPPKNPGEYQALKTKFSTISNSVDTSIRSLDTRMHHLFRERAELEASHQVRWVIASIKGEWDGQTLGGDHSYNNWCPYFDIIKESFNRKCAQEKRNSSSKGYHKRNHYTHVLIQLNHGGSWDVIERSDKPLKD